MKTINSDLRRELETRIHEIQSEIAFLQADRAKIDEKLKAMEEKVAALRTVYGMEAERLGEPKAPLFPEKGKPYRFAGMRLIDALAVIRDENPRILKMPFGKPKREALKILQQEGFDFKGKRPLPAVHFAWIALDRRKK